MSNARFNIKKSIRNILELPAAPINAYRKYRTPERVTEITRIPHGEIRRPVQPNYISLTGRKQTTPMTINQTFDLTKPKYVPPVINSERWNAPPKKKDPGFASAPMTGYGKDPKMGLSNFHRVDRPRSLDDL